MINQQARREAIAIAGGAEPTEDTPDKVALYGVMARCLDVTRLSTVKIPPVETFFKLEATATEILEQHAFDTYQKADPADKNRIEELLAKRDNNDAFFGSLWSDGSLGARVFMQGAFTSVDMELATLRTIGREAREGTGVSERGLRLSGRVPFKVALLHMKDLIAEESFRRRWVSPQGDAGPSYSKDVITFDRDEGLTLLPYPEFDLQLIKDAHGPQIGCPATLVRGYIRGVHELVSRAAVDSGLLQVS
jgi:hypothetical protein